MPAVIESLPEPGADEPGVAVSVIRGGKIISQRYAGLASLESRIPIGPQTRFHIVSVSKTFAAAAVLVLAARGTLSLDDDIRRAIPELPEPARPGESAVTIRHLLSMTSGLRDVLEIERLRTQLARAGLLNPRIVRRDGAAPLIGSTAVMHALRSRIHRVAATDFTVLLEGPSDPQ